MAKDPPRGVNRALLFRGSGVVPIHEVGGQGRGAAEALVAHDVDVFSRRDGHHVHAEVHVLLEPQDGAGAGSAGANPDGELVQNELKALLEVKRRGHGGVGFEKRRRRVELEVRRQVLQDFGNKSQSFVWATVWGYT